MASLACVLVGGASFALSYVALSEVAVRERAVPGALGWLVPIVVDGGVICGSAIIWSQSKSTSTRPVFPFLFVGTLVIISVIVNASHAGPSILAKGIASLPPLVLLGTLELVASQGRRDRLQAVPVPVTPKPVVTDLTVPLGRPEQHIASQPPKAAPRQGTPNTVRTQSTAPFGDADDGRPLATDDLIADHAGAMDTTDGWTTPSSIDVELTQITTAARRTNPNRRAVRVRAEGPGQ